MIEVLNELRRAVRSQRNRWLCDSVGVSPDDVVSIVVERSLSSRRGVAYARGAELRRFASVAVRCALIDEARRRKTRGGPHVDVGDVVLEDRAPSPLDVAIERQAMRRVLDFPTLAAAINGSTCTEQATGRGVQVSTVTRATERAVRQIRDEMFGPQRSLFTHEEMSGGAM